VGKSRLAVAVAEDAGDDVRDGVSFVSLGGIDDASLVGPAIAEALGVREAGEQPLGEAIADFLGKRTALLVLDSCERVAKDGAFLSDLLAACPRLKVLATSRIVLHLTVEHLFTVPPLPVPDLAPAMPDRELADLAAVRLFRTRAASSGVDPGDGNLAAVAEICRRLDGLPLAIELAAARIRVFSPDALLSRLERRLPLLSGGPQDAPERHRTLTATIAWSYELLPETERRILRALSVFAGGFSPEASALVAGCDDPQIAILADHSLLHRLDLPGTGSRFAMLDTVREFAQDRLVDNDEAEAARLRHAGWCLELAGSARASMGGPGQQAWLDRLDVEHDNLRAALQAARMTGDAETLARLANGLWRFWYGRGFYTEGRIWVGEALAAVDILSPPVRLDLLVGGGTLAHAQGDERQGVRLADEALAFARDGHDQEGLALALNLRGVIARDHGEYERAVELLEKSLSISRSLGHVWGIVLSSNSLAILHQLRGEYDEAAIALQESADLARAEGDGWGTAQALSNMAHLCRRQGDFERAAALYEESGALYREIGDRRGEAVSLTNLGRIAERLGQLDRAIELHGQSLDASRTLGDRRGMSTAFANLGVAWLRRGDPDAAMKAIRESLAIRHALDDREGVSTSLEKLAEVEVARGNPEQALRLWAAAAAFRDAIGAPLAPSERASYDIVISAARAALGDARIAAIWAEGRLQSANAAVAAAMSDVVQPVATTGNRTLVEPAGSAFDLTPRELDVLRLLEVHTDREIADALFIGPRTVGTHVTNILNKLGVNTRTAAVAFAIRHGII
jgi:predicted ATPase/DNA-binding CsgD family transcriptional regulator/Tfp pilus assembly protein PilF